MEFFLDSIFWYINCIKDSILHRFTSQHSAFYWPYFITGYLLYFVFKKFNFSEIKKHFQEIQWNSRSLRIDIYTFIFIVPLAGYLANYITTMENLNTWLGISSFLNTKINPIPSSKGLTIQVLWILGGLIFSDLIHYFIHRALHGIPFLWEFHKIHHSATDLFFITSYRFHFIDAILIYSAEGIAMLAWTFLGKLLWGLDPYQFFIYVLPTVLFLRKFYTILSHSSCWLRFPNWLSHILQSPAMHQIHHSKDADHFGKNIAGKFAIWDWVFGTLYIPAETCKNSLQFGVNSKLSYDSFAQSIVSPFYLSYEVVFVLIKRLIHKTIKLRLSYYI